MRSDRVPGGPGGGARARDRLAAYRAEALAAGADPRGYVCPGKDGGPMNERSPNQILARTLRRAGLLDEDDRPTVTVHGLRHTAASIMLVRRVPLISVSKQLGHANIQITATIYAHLLDDSELDAAAAVFDEPSDPRGTTEPTTERPPLGVVIPLPVRDSARARSSL